MIRYAGLYDYPDACLSFELLSILLMLLFILSSSLPRLLSAVSPLIIHGNGMITTCISK